MPSPAKPLNVLAPQIEAERQRIRAQFDGGATAKQTLRALCEVADDTIQQIFSAVMKVHESPEEGLALLRAAGLTGFVIEDSGRVHRVAGLEVFSSCTQ